MAVQVMRNPEDDFKDKWLSVYTVVQKVLKEVLVLKHSSTAKKYPEVARNIDLVYQYLEDTTTRLHKVNDVMDTV